MRVLVTGAGGFLAGPLIERLTKAGAPPLRLAPGTDLSDPAAARAAVASTRPDRVYHLAGTTRATAWDAQWRAHVTATVNLLDALAARGVHARVLVVGSSAAHGAAGGAKRAGETAPCEPVNAYGSIKLAQELAALSCSRGALEVVVARLFNVLGPGCPENLAPGAFARQIARAAAGLQSADIAVGDLSPRRDYLDGRDAAAALETIMRRGAAGQVYNVGSGRPTSMRAVFDGLTAAAGVRARPKVDRARLRPAQVRELVADARKLRALGWSPKVPLQTALHDTMAWWLAR